MGMPLAEISNAGFMDPRSGSTADELHLLNGVLAGSPVAVAVLDAQLRCVRINEAFARAAGLRARDYLGRALVDVVPEIGGAIEPICRRVLELGTPYGNVPLDGPVTGPLRQSRRWLASAYPVRGPRGHLLGLGVMMIDVTAEHQAEEALRDSQALLRDTQEIANVGSWAWDLRADMVTWSDELYRICGVEPSRGPLTTEMAMHTMDPDDRHRIRLANEAAIRDRTTTSYDHRVVRPDGSVRSVHCRGRVVVDADGTAVRMIGSAQDITERRDVESALEESEARFRTLFERAGVGIGLTATDGRLLQANPAMCEMLGYTQAEMLELTSIDITHAEDRAEQAGYLEALLSGAARSHISEKRFVRKDGGIMWGRATVSVVRDADGAAMNFIAVVENITPRKETEAALAQSESRYAHVASQIPGVVYQYVYEPGGRNGFTYVSEGARDLFGTGPDEVLPAAATLFSCIHPDERDELKRRRAFAVETLSPMWWEGRVTPRPGDERWIQLASRPTKKADGTIVFDGLIMDVSELRRTQESVRRRERQFVGLAENSPDVIARFDLAGRHVYVNGAVEAATGIPREAWIGKSHAELGLPPAFATMWADAIQRVIHTGARTDLAFEIDAPSGLRHFECRLAPEFDGDVLESVLAIGSDVTERWALEAQLRQAQKMEAVGRLAGGVAHDFNNLLTVIQNYSEFVAEHVAEDAAALADVNEVLRAASNAATLTRQLLAFSRQQVLQPRHIDVNQSVCNVATMLRRVIGEDIRIDVDLATAPWSVFADAGQMEQVLMNLAVNARDAMPQGGVLRFRTRAIEIDDSSAGDGRALPRGAYMSIIVEDSGDGIAPAVLPNIFEPFFTTKGPGKGTGLGLATVYGVVQQSGGHLRVESVVGEGSRFIIDLPRADGARIPVATAAAIAEPARGAERILLVEDDTSVRAVIRRQLERQGYRVHDVGSGTEALSCAADAAEPFDILLTDVVMPEMSGREIAAALLAAHPGIRVVFMSGYNDDEILRRGLAVAGQAYLEKPFTLGRLAAAMREVLEWPGTGQAGGTSPR